LLFGGAIQQGRSKSGQGEADAHRSDFMKMERNAHLRLRDGDGVRVGAASSSISKVSRLSRSILVARRLRIGRSRQATHLESCASGFRMPLAPVDHHDAASTAVSVRRVFGEVFVAGVVD
jgi:hypothetical protein